MIRRMAEALYLDFRTGQVLELVPKVGFRYVFEGGKLTVPPGSPRGTTNHQLTIGDPDGIRGYHAQWPFVAEVDRAVELLWVA